jgi:hypothetical protein
MHMLKTSDRYSLIFRDMGKFHVQTHSAEDQISSIDGKVKFQVEDYRVSGKKNK